MADRSIWDIPVLEPEASITGGLTQPQLDDPVTRLLGRSKQEADTSLVFVSEYAREAGEASAEPPATTSFYTLEPAVPMDHPSDPRGASNQRRPSRGSPSALPNSATAVTLPRR